MEKVSLSELALQKNAGRRTLFETEELCLYTGIKNVAIIVKNHSDRVYNAHQKVTFPIIVYVPQF
ncbi:hypothetical protein SAMN05421636_109189 [Pricia antarctica]|uniref:Uncharacterized protein n=1 Tax=Pricia antarctica TaxID=641691 RepID=A0A1G7HIP9_9FLAO|nr:hypothetical protein [Pricia antarctica]SDF00268.1 hypothetical protein SAMN05421636_109189 [Pricia antarctica]